MSWMIILLLLYKLLPYKRTMTAILASGTAVGFYFLDHVTSSGLELLYSYPYELAGVSIFFAILSMALIYYFGPPSTERGLNLLQWFMQASALYLVFQSSYCKEFTVTVILTLIVLQFISLQNFFKRIVNRMTPKRVRYWYYRPRSRTYLTIQEYEEQGNVKTQHALEELRKYCSSPQCDSWKVVSKLENPRKFAHFLTKGEHVSSEELERYDLFDKSDEQLNLLQDDNDRTFDHENERSLIHGTVANHMEWLSEDETMNTSLVSND